MVTYKKVKAERDDLAADNALLRVEIAKWRADSDVLAAGCERLDAESEARHASCVALTNSVTKYRERVAALEAENTRLNMEMVVYRQKLTPADAQAMRAVIDALDLHKRSEQKTEGNQ